LKDSWNGCTNDGGHSCVPHGLLNPYAGFLRCPFTLKSIKTGTWFQNSDDGKLVAFPYAALTTLIRKHLGAFLEPFSIGPPEWCDIVPYNVGPLQALSNEAAFASRLEAWAALRARFSVADNDLFRKVSNVLVLDLTKVTPTKARTMVASFLIQKAAEKESPWHGPSPLSSSSAVLSRAAGGRTFSMACQRTIIALKSGPRHSSPRWTRKTGSLNVMCEGVRAALPGLV